MKLIRDAFRSDVLILNTDDLDILADGKEIKASGMVIKTAASIMECIAIEKDKRLMAGHSLNYLFIPSHQWASFQREVECVNCSVLDPKCLGDGSLNFQGMTLFRYDGKMIKVL